MTVLAANKRMVFCVMGIYFTGYMSVTSQAYINADQYQLKVRPLGMKP